MIRLTAIDIRHYTDDKTQRLIFVMRAHQQYPMSNIKGDGCCAGALCSGLQWEYESHQRFLLTEGEKCSLAICLNCTLGSFFILFFDSYLGRRSQAIRNFRTFFFLRDIKTHYFPPASTVALGSLASCSVTWRYSRHRPRSHMSHERKITRHLSKEKRDSWSGLLL